MVLCSVVLFLLVFSSRNTLAVPRGEIFHSLGRDSIKKLDTTVSVGLSTRTVVTDTRYPGNRSLNLLQWLFVGIDSFGLRGLARIFCKVALKIR